MTLFILGILFFPIATLFNDTITSLNTLISTWITLKTNELAVANQKIVEELNKEESSAPIGFIYNEEEEQEEKIDE